MATRPGQGRERERLDNRKEQEGRLTDKLKDTPHYKREQERKAKETNGSGRPGDKGYNKAGYDWDKMPDSWAQEIYDKEGRDQAHHTRNGGPGYIRPEFDEWRSKKEGNWSSSDHNLDRQLKSGEITREQFGRAKHGRGREPGEYSAAGGQGGQRRTDGPSSPPPGNGPAPRTTGDDIRGFNPAEWDPDDRSEGFRRRRKEARDWRNQAPQNKPAWEMNQGMGQPQQGQEYQQQQEPDWASIFGQQYGNQSGYQQPGTPGGFMGGMGQQASGFNPQMQQMMQMFGGGQQRQQYGQQGFGQQQAPNPFQGMGMRGGMF